MTSAKDTPSTHRLALLALSLGSFGIGTSEFSSMGLLQLFAGDLKIDVADATDPITAYALGVVIGAPLVTIAAARLNRRTLLMLLLGLFILGNLVSSLASSLGFLVVGRFISGMPQGAYFGAGAVVATYIVGPERGGKAFALVVSGLTIATIIGAPIGTYIGQTFGWRIAYRMIAAYGVLAFFALSLWLPKTAALDGKSIVSELAALRNPNVWLMMLIAALSVASVFAVYTFVGPFVTDMARLSPSLIPLALGLFGAGMAIGNIPGGHMADTHAFRGMIVGFTGTLVFLAIMGIYGSNAYVLMLGLFATGAMIMIAIPTIPVRLTRMAPEAPSLMGAMNMASFNVANAIGAAAGGATVGAGLGLFSTIWAGFALTAVGLLTLAALLPRFRQAAT